MNLAYRTATAVLAWTVGILVGPVPAGATPDNYNPDICPSGYSCYYDQQHLARKIWTAPSCGFFDLGRFSPPINDRVSSIVNLGGGTVWAYNWTESGWVQVGESVPVGLGENFTGTAENIIDAVLVGC